MPRITKQLSPPKPHPATKGLPSPKKPGDIAERTRHARKPAWNSYPGELSPYKALQAARLRWLKQVRSEQLINHHELSIPERKFLLYLFITGRGWGKTRSCAEEILDFVRRNWKHKVRGALVAPTFSDARDTMVEGESGLLSIIPTVALQGHSIDRAWNRTIGELVFSNGSRLKIFTSERPRSLRGPQHHVAWAEEIAQWQDAHKGNTEDTTWSNLLFGLRLGKSPYIVGGTTPRNVELLKTLLADSKTVIQKGKTRDNLPNLSDSFAGQIISQYHGTRLGRQELYGELLLDNPDALWQMPWIDRSRVFSAPESPSRVVVAIDIATTSRESSDHTGIIACASDYSKHNYVLADFSGKYTPDAWARKAIFLYRDLSADCIVAEGNNGGDLIKTVINDRASEIPVKIVNATRDKKTRAEPIAHLYEKTPPTVHHVDFFPELEDQLVTWNPRTDRESPDRLDALVWGLTYLTKPHRGGLRA